MTEIKSKFRPVTVENDDMIMMGFEVYILISLFYSLYKMNGMPTGSDAYIQDILKQ